MIFVLLQIGLLEREQGFDTIEFIVLVELSFLDKNANLKQVKPVF